MAFLNENYNFKFLYLTLFLLKTKKCWSAGPGAKHARLPSFLITFHPPHKNLHIIRLATVPAALAISAPARVYLVLVAFMLIKYTLMV